MDVTAEFTIEPFIDGTPGAHVLAALEAVRDVGLEPSIGPFGSSITGDLTAVSAAVARLLEAATAAGATRVSLQLTRPEPLEP